MEINLIKLLERAERAFVIGSLMLYMGAIIPLLITQGASEGDGIDIFAFNYTPLNLLYLLNYFITFVLLLLRWRKTLDCISKNILFASLIIMIPLSCLWSVKPDETVTGSIGVLGTTCFGIYIASRFTLKEQLNLIASAFSLTILLSLLFIIALPKYGIMGGVHAGIPRGVFTHKNGMGKFMVLSTSIFLLLVRSKQSKYNYAWLGLFGSVLLILASRSTGALLNGGILISIILFSQIFQLRTQVFIAFVLLLSSFAWAFSVWSLDIATIVLGAFGKDLSLTGRTEIWPFVIDKIQERPWLGYGFNGFWHSINGESAYVIRAVRWDVPDSHNGYLDFMLNLGLLGFSLFLLISWVTLLKAYVLLQEKFSWVDVWPIVFLLYLTIVNFTETSLVSQNNIFWVLYTSVALSVSTHFKQVFDHTNRFKAAQNESRTLKGYDSHSMQP